jgi:hypothetical protein
VVFVDVANVLNHENLRNTSPGIDRAGRVFDATESLLPIVPSGGLVIESNPPGRRKLSIEQGGRMLTVVPFSAPSVDDRDRAIAVL